MTAPAETGDAGASRRHRNGAGALVALAPAKLNLCLYVGPVRSDGLHEICSLLVPISLVDELTLSAGTRDEVVCPAIRGPNLAAAALAAFRERFDWRGPPVGVTIRKRIPIAAGLGGGSADAAATLRLLCVHAGIDPPAAELQRLALELGADVPSQLDPRPLLVTGAGETLEPVSQNWPVWAVLLTTRARLRTARVYARADEIRRPRADLGEPRARLDAARAAIDPLLLGDLLQNDLQEATLALEPMTAAALDLLQDAGARVALVSGSGPTAFGLFAGREEARVARDRLAGEWHGDAILAEAVEPGLGAPRPA